MPKQVMHESQPVLIPRRVFFAGTTAIQLGIGLCYDRDYGTAEDTEGRRDRYVEVPSGSNNNWFAGVAARDYAAKAAGQWIEIYEPGSTCFVSAGIDTTVAVTKLTCSASDGDAGKFTQVGFMGRGSALALETQTNAIVTDRTGAASVSTLTLTDTGNLGDVEDGDFVYITGGDGGTVTVGRYVATAVNSNDLTLDSAPGDGNITYYVVRANKVVLAYLYTGDASGLTEVVSAEGATAVQSMVGGVTFIAGGFAVSGSDSTSILANGTVVGEVKGFACLGTLSSNEWNLTVTTGKQLDRSTGLGNAQFDGAGHVLWLRWYETTWIAEWTTGAALS